MPWGVDQDPHGRARRAAGRSAELTDRPVSVSGVEIPLGSNHRNQARTTDIIQIMLQKERRYSRIAL
jgi:hypothetical protein